MDQVEGGLVEPGDPDSIIDSPVGIWRKISGNQYPVHGKVLSVSKFLQFTPYFTDCSQQMC
jgi:hypothetical protein